MSVNLREPVLQTLEEIVRQIAEIKNVRLPARFDVRAMIPARQLNALFTINTDTNKIIRHMKNALAYRVDRYAKIGLMGLYNV